MRTKRRMPNGERGLHHGSASAHSLSALWVPKLEEDGELLQGHRAVDLKKSQAGIVEAWVRRTAATCSPSVAAVPAGSAGVLRTRRIVQAPTGGRARAVHPGSSDPPAAVLHGQALNQRDGVGADRRPTRARRIRSCSWPSGAGATQDGAWATRHAPAGSWAAAG
jgi:hypothetical protein